MDNIEQFIEALIFASDQSISKTEITNCLHGTFEVTYPDDEIEELLRNIMARYQSDDFAIQLINTGGGYQFLTKPIYYPIINQLQTQQAKRKLSQAGLETLAIIASKKTVTKLEIEQIRGVNSDYTVQKLLEKELIQLAGKADQPGKPIMYCVSKKFLDYFGLNSTTDIPILKDVEITNTSAIGKNNE
ncbi:MAG: SMC-Scp complex subunit ScpB [Sphingobacteriales bacterium]|nr:MAG: SMC-Scp complex subunit ScpB [Sphingobacteriales bacterium]TAF79144.1 MAG: SMC-Scp complex subunit ScpB [Sphingobacteriales bacterium]